MPYQYPDENYTLPSLLVVSSRWLQVPYLVVALDSDVEILCQNRSIPHLNYSSAATEK